MADVTPLMPGVRRILLSTIPSEVSRGRALYGTRALFIYLAIVAVSSLISSFWLSVALPDSQFSFVFAMLAGPGIFLGLIIPFGQILIELILIGIVLTGAGVALAFACGFFQRDLRIVLIVSSVVLWWISGILGYQLIFYGA